MRAAVTEAFGGVDCLGVRSLPKPSPGPGEALVRVRAASINPMDCKLREGKLCFLFRVTPPFVLGFDLAGEVEAVGPGVTRLRPGDTVFGTTSRPGAHAEWAVATEELLGAGGTYVTALPGPGPFLWRALTALPLFGGRRCRALMLRPTRRDLDELARLAEAGALRPAVGEVFGLDAIREAHLRMQSGHARGKIVVRP